MVEMAAVDGGDWLDVTRIEVPRMQENTRQRLGAGTTHIKSNVRAVLRRRLEWRRPVSGVTGSEKTVSQRSLWRRP
jgi:hypothetical protein